MKRFVETDRLHAIGAGWSREKRGQIVGQVQLLRQQLGLDEKGLPLVLNIPDYHGEAAEEKDIKKGMYYKDGGYYVWQDIGAHDVDSYFRDAEFLAEPYVRIAEKELNIIICLAI
jgi:hypothetical protein